MASTSTSSSSSRSSSVLDDPSNPLYLHHEESPVAMLVYQPLVEENYPTWARSMQMALIAKNKLGFIDGTLTLSSPMVKTSSAIQAWVHCDKMVASWILNSVSQEIATRIACKGSALEIWNDLRERLSQGNEPRVFQLQKDIAGITQGQSSITSTPVTKVSSSSGNKNNKNSKGKEKLTCNHCGMNGHTVEKNSSSASTSFTFTEEQCQLFLATLGTNSTSMAEFVANNSELGSPTISEERIPSLVEFSFSPSAKLESVSSVLNGTNPIPTNNSDTDANGARSLSISLLFPPDPSESNETPRAAAQFSHSIASCFPPGGSETESSSEICEIISTNPSISTSPRRTTTSKEILKPKSSNSSKSNRIPLKFPHFKINSMFSKFSAAKSRTNSSKRSGFKDMEIIYGEKFPLKMLLEATHNFSKDRKIETDQFGSTYHAILDDGREVAIKCADNDNEFLIELQASCRLNHKNVVRLLGFCGDSKERILVHEYVGNDTLHGHLHNPESSSLMSWVARIKVALDIARGIEYLHVYAVPPIIHRDIKPSNIFLDAMLTAKLYNFNISMKSDIEHEPIAGTVGYMDPEYLIFDSLTTEVDVYSFGVVLLEMLSGLSALHKNQNGEGRHIVEFVVPYIAQKEIHRFLDPKVPPPTSLEMEALANVASLALDCVSKERVLRPSMTKVANNIQSTLEGILEE